MRGIGRKFRRTINTLSKLRPWQKQPSLSAYHASQTPSTDFVILAHPAIPLTQKLLRRFAAFLAQNPTAEVAYCDETNFYKPDWSPELLRSMNYPGPLCVIRPAALAAVGGAPQAFDETGFYDLWLRIAESNLLVAHVATALFDRPPAPADQGASCKGALDAHARRQYGEGNYEIRDSSLVAARPATFDFLIKTDSSPLISLIIPTKDGLSMLAPCIDSILNRSTHRRVEIIVLNNNSTKPETFAYFDQLRSGEIPQCRVIDAPIPFNWSRLNNIGAAAATGDVLVFMNNDMEVLAADWLEWLAGYALQPAIGVVGAQLIREDETLQHAGVVLGLGGWCDHIFDHQPPALLSTEFVPPGLIRNVSAVTGACMAVAAEKFRQYGGFDENYLVCGSDIEYCLRLFHAGLRNVYLSPARLYHLESRTRNPNDSDPDRLRFRQLLKPYRWQGDPFYNENLSLYDNCGKMRSRWE